MKLNLSLFYPYMVAYFCHFLPHPYVDVSVLDPYVDLSDIHVDLSDSYDDMSLN